MKIKRHNWAETPLLSRGGESRRGSGGWGGVGQEINLLTNTTPSARAKVASQPFLCRAASPPLLRLRAIALALRGLRRGVCVLIVVLFAILLGSAQNPPGGSAVINQYCITCHNQRAKTAGLMLDTMDFDHVEKDPATWEKVVRKIKTGMMPPS